MRTTITFLTALIICATTFSQSVGIGTSSPHASARLDITSTNRGLLIPRMTTAAINSISNPAKGLMIYDSVKNQLMVNMGSSPAPNWQTIVSTSGWTLTGNSGISAASNFIGTTDNNPLQFRINNRFAGKIDSVKAPTFLGYGAGMMNEGYYNTAIGYSALKSNVSGLSNTAVGYSALSSNSSGQNNTGVGYLALSSNSSGQSNVAIGHLSLTSNTIGGQNVALGYYTLYNNAAGYYNVAIGAGALLNNTSGEMNTAVGLIALQNNLTGDNNVAIGGLAGCNVSTNPFNFTAIGYNAGHVGSASNTIEFGNTSIIWNGGNVGWSTYSDARIKTDIKEEVAGLDFITRLRPVTYYRSNAAIEKLVGITDTTEYPGKNDIEKIRFSGFIAQEVEAAAQAAGYDFSGITVPKNDKQIYSLSYEQFVVPLVKAVQELSKQNDEMKKRNEALLKRIERLESLQVKK